jgi:hypothetical protein
MRLLPPFQSLRDHPGDLSAAGEHLVGQRPHETQGGAAVHEADAALDELAPEGPDLLLEGLVAHGGRGAAVDADVLQVHGPNTTFGV